FRISLRVRLGSLIAGLARLVGPFGVGGTNFHHDHRRFWRVAVNQGHRALACHGFMPYTGLTMTCPSHEMTTRSTPRLSPLPPMAMDVVRSFPVRSHLAPLAGQVNSDVDRS